MLAGNWCWARSVRQGPGHPVAQICYATRWWRCKTCAFLYMNVWFVLCIRLAQNNCSALLHVTQDGYSGWLLHVTQDMSWCVTATESMSSCRSRSWTWRRVEHSQSAVQMKSCQRFEHAALLQTHCDIWRLCSSQTKSLCLAEDPGLSAFVDICSVWHAMSSEPTDTLTASLSCLQPQHEVIIWW